MKYKLILFITVFLLAACSSPGTQKKELSEENLTHVHLDVSGMTCEGCEKSIVASINKLDGIEQATASHEHEEAMIVFDSTLTSIPEIEKAITDAGYSVEGEAAHPHH